MQDLIRPKELVQKGHNTPVTKKDREGKNGIIWAALRLKMEGTEHDLDNQDDGLKKTTRNASGTKVRMEWDERRAKRSRGSMLTTKARMELFEKQQRRNKLDTVLWSTSQISR